MTPEHPNERAAALSDERPGHRPLKEYPDFCAECCTRWPCDYEDMGQEITRLQAALDAMTARAEVAERLVERLTGRVDYLRLYAEE